MRVRRHPVLVAATLAVLTLGAVPVAAASGPDDPGGGVVLADGPTDPGDDEGADDPASPEVPAGAGPQTGAPEPGADPDAPEPAPTPVAPAPEEEANDAPVDGGPDGADRSVEADEVGVDESGVEEAAVEESGVVEAGELAERTADPRPDFLRLTPEQSNAAVGEVVTFTALAQYDGAPEQDVTDEAVFTVIGGAGTCVANACELTQPGYLIVRATWSGAAGMATVVTRPGPGVELSWSPRTVRAIPGEAVRVRPVLRDAQGHLVGDVSEVVLEVPDEVECPGASWPPTCSSQVVGSHVITASLSDDPSQRAELEFEVLDRVGAVSGLRLELDSTEVQAGEPFDVRVLGLDGAGEPVDVTSSPDTRLLLVHPAHVDFPRPIGSCEAGTCVVEGGPLVFELLAYHRWTTAQERITVRGAPASFDLVPAAGVVAPGDLQSFEPRWFNARGERVYVDPSDEEWQVVLTGEDGAECDWLVCVANEPGRYAISATGGNLTATTTLVVGNSQSAALEEVDHIEVHPEVPHVTAGQPLAFIVLGYDAAGQLLGEVDGAELTVDGAGRWRTPLGEHRVGCAQQTCTSTIAREHTVTATVGGHEASTTYTVEPGQETDRLGLAPGNAVVRPGERQAFHFGRTDEYGNLANLTSGPVGSRLVASEGAECEAYVCWSDAPGTYVVSVDYYVDLPPEVVPEEMLAFPTATVMTVVQPEVAHIEVTAQPSRVAAGETVTMSATAYDDRDVAVGDVTDQTVFEGTGALSCTGNTCTSTVAGAYEVTGVHDGMRDSASVTVTAAAADHDELTPPSASLRVGEAVTYRVERFDEFDNPIAVVTDDYALAGSTGLACDGATCVATAPGAQRVTATADGQPALTAEVTVVLPDEAYLVVTPDVATTVAGVPADFTATLHASDGGVVQDVTTETDFVAADPASCAAAACSSRVAGTHLVTGTWQELSDDAALEVTAAGVDSIEVTPAEATIDAGGTQEFVAAGADEFGNPVGDLTEEAEWSIDGVGSCEGSACGADEAGEFTVTGRYVVPGLARAVPWAAAAPGDVLTASATLVVRAAPADPDGETGGDAGDDPDGTDPDDGGDPDDPDSSDDTAADAAFGVGPTTAAGADTLPAAGARAEWWHVTVGLLLLSVGASVLWRLRRRTARPVPGPPTTQPLGSTPTCHSVPVEEDACPEPPNACDVPPSGWRSSCASATRPWPSPA